MEKRLTLQRKHSAGPATLRPGYSLLNASIPAWRKPSWNSTISWSSGLRQLLRFVLRGIRLIFSIHGPADGDALSRFSRPRSCLESCDVFKGHGPLLRFSVIPHSAQQFLQGSFSVTSMISRLAFGIRMIQGNRKIERLRLVREAVNARHHARSGDCDVFGSQVQSARIVQQMRCLHYLVIVVEGLSHSHEHHVCESFRACRIGGGISVPDGTLYTWSTICQARRRGISMCLWRRTRS